MLTLCPKQIALVLLIYFISCIFVSLKTQFMKQLSLLLLLAGVLFTSCSTSTKLINSWSDKDNTPKSYENIGVTVLFPNSSNRYITEHAIVDELKAKGLNGMSTVDVFPMAERVAMSEDIMKNSEAVRNGIAKKVNENNIDALLIVTLFNQTQEERWVKNNNFGWGGTDYYGTPLGIHGSYYDYYAYSIGTIYKQGYYVDKISYFIEYNLYDIKTEKLIWRAQTKTTNLKSVEEEAKAAAGIVAKQLTGKKVVSK